MEKLTFDISINAPAAKVWKTLWDDASYREWTAVFSPGSCAVSDWKEGSEILFTDATQKNGMFALIEKKTENAVMIFRHLGEIKDGVKSPKNWDGAHESYFLTEKNGVTGLRTELDAPADFADYFNTTFPKALQKVKEISER